MISVLGAGGSGGLPSSEPVRCCVHQQGTAEWNDTLFVWTTLADLDRLDPERLFCLTQRNDKSIYEIFFFLFSEI